MAEEKNSNAMEIEENPKIVQEVTVEKFIVEKNEEKRNADEKTKKKKIKRAPMEKTVEDTIKDFDKLLQEEVSIYIN